MTAADQSPELRALADALDGRQPPCFDDPDAWFDQPDVAATRCLEDCHARAECARYAESIQPSHGVWAGVNYERKPGRRRSA